jgi:hypothetical protein
MFNLMSDGKLRGSNLAYERPLCANSGRSISLIMRHRTGGHSIQIPRQLG